MRGFKPAFRSLCSLCLPAPSRSRPWCRKIVASTGSGRIQLPDGLLNLGCQINRPCHQVSPIARRIACSQSPLELLISVGLRAGLSQRILVVEPTDDDDPGRAIETIEEAVPVSEELHPEPVPSIGAKRVALPMPFGSRFEGEHLHHDLRHGAQENRVRVGMRRFRIGSARTAYGVRKPNDLLDGGLVKQDLPAVDLQRHVRAPYRLRVRRRGRLGRSPAISRPSCGGRRREGCRHCGPARCRYR